MTLCAFLVWGFWPSGLSGVGGDFTPEYFAEINPADSVAIIDAVATVTKEPILGVYVESPRRVQVTTGYQRGGLDGEGHIIYLEKKWWTWEVVHVGPWFS